MKKRLFHALLLLTGFSTSFFACSDDSSSKSSGEEVYATFDDLPHCGKSRRGDTVYVESESVRYTCTEDGWIIADDGEGSSASSEDTTKVETVPVDSATVLGFAQKGPFVDGSTVTITGVDSLLESTKEKFSGKVSGDSGAYSVSGVTLQNQYALVTANGFFFNGVSGKKNDRFKNQAVRLGRLDGHLRCGERQSQREHIFPTGIRARRQSRDWRKIQRSRSQTPRDKRTARRIWARLSGQRFCRKQPRGNSHVPARHGLRGSLPVCGGHHDGRRFESGENFIADKQRLQRLCRRRPFQRFERSGFNRGLPFIGGFCGQLCKHPEKRLGVEAGLSRSRLRKHLARILDF